MLIEKGKGKTGAGTEGEGATVVVVPPDGGWGWMVVFGSFMIHLIADGMAYSFGVYVKSFVDHFNVEYSQIGFLGSLMLGVTWGSGPIASMLTNKYGCRLVAILGTVIAAIGFLMSIFAPNIYFMYFSFGIVAGVGLGFAYLPAIVAVSFYFEKRRSLATGLAVCGSGFGTFIFAPLTQFLLDEYGWKGTILIEVGLLLNCIPCGAVFRPVEAPRPRRPAGPMANEAEGRGSESTTTVEKAAKEGGESAEIGLGKAELVSSGGGGVGGYGSVDTIEKRTTTIDDEDPQLTTSDPTSDRSRLRLSSTASSSATSTHHVVPVVGPMDRKDVYYNRSLQNIPLYRSDPDMYRRSIVSIPRGNDDDDDDDGGGCRCLGGGDGGSTTARQPMMDCSLMIDPCFLLFAISNFLTSFGYVIAYIFLPDRATVAGISDKQAASLISIIGISNTVGRIVFGFMADYKWVNRLVLYNTALVLCGVMSLLSALGYIYPWMAAYAASFGLFIGVYICLTPIVIVDLLGLDKLSNAFGIVLLFQGIGTVLGPPIAGAIYDKTQDYNNSFYLMGACIAVSGAMLYCIPCIQRHQQRTASTSDGRLAVDA